VIFHLKKPALFEDDLVIETFIEKLSAVTIIMKQNIYKLELVNNGNKKILLVEAKVKLATINKESKPIKMPEEILNVMKSCL